MRLDALDLIAFGPFTEVRLDLSEGREGLHLILGPNEAGKSSAMRAVQDLLYGIPHLSADNFLHKHTDMRIGGTLRRPDGATLAILRRKGAKKTLSRADDGGQQSLDDDALDPWLGGLAREAFCREFTIDHGGLLRGGADLVKGGGDLGAALFAAGSGLGNLRTVQKQLDSEMGELFKPTGKNQAINKLLAELKQKRDVLRDTQVPSELWTRHDAALIQAGADREALAARRAAIVAERSRLDDVRRARPHLAQYVERREALDALGDVPLLADDFSDRRHAAEDDLRAASRRRDDAHRALVEFDAALAALGPPSPLLAAADRIEQVRDDRTKLRDARRNRPELAREADRLDAEARAALAALRPDLTLDGVDALRPTEGRRASVQNHGARLAAILAAVSRARAEALRLSGLVEPGDAPAAADLDALDRALAAARGEGDIEGRLADAARDLAEAERAVSADLETLRHWSGPLEALEALAVPDPATLDAHEAATREADGAARSLAADLLAAEAARDAAATHLDRLRAAGDVPAEDDLARARARRDLAWGGVLEDWLAVRSGGATPLDFDAASARALAYAAEVKAADDLADRLRREASRAAEFAHAVAALRDGDDRLRSLRARLRRARRAARHARAAWSACFWSGLGVEPATVAETRTWIGTRRSLVDRADSLRARRRECSGLAARIADNRSALALALARIAPTEKDDGETLAGLIARGSAILERARASIRARAEADAARRDLDAAEAAEAAWRDEWAALVAPLGLGRDHEPGDADRVLRKVDQLAQNRVDAAAFRRAIAEVDRDAARHEAAVASLVASVAPDLAASAVDLAAEALLSRLVEARAADAERNALLKQRGSEEIKLRVAEASRRDATDRLAALCREASVASPELLPEAERVAAAARALRDRLAEADRTVRDIGRWPSVDAALRDESAEADVSSDDLARRIAGLDREIASHESKISDLDRAIGSETKALEGMDGLPDAARVGEDVESLLAKLGVDADRFARARLASAVLDEAIRRHRQKNEGPVLGRARALFSRLTCGSFQTLQVDYDDADTPTLLGVRPDTGATVRVNQMSLGTADQLYLALRLASLEAHLDRHPGLPLVVDDILVQFDDLRASAALGALADLSSRTQILFFTHHAHLIDLARTRLEPGRFFVHELPRHPFNGAATRGRDGDAAGTPDHAVASRPAVS